MGQPNYEKNQFERDLIELDDEDEEGGHWTVPKIIGIAAAGLCLAAILAASVQFLLRKREKKLAFKLRRHKDGDDSSQTSFTSFDSDDSEQERRRERRKKRLERKKRTEGSSLSQAGSKMTKAWIRKTN